MDTHVTPLLSCSWRYKALKYLRISKRASRTHLRRYILQHRTCSSTRKLRIGLWSTLEGNTTNWGDITITLELKGLWADHR